MPAAPPPFPLHVPRPHDFEPFDPFHRTASRPALERLIDAVAALRLDIAELRAELAPPATFLIVGREAVDAFRRLK